MITALCKNCNKSCQRESVDVGVGIIHGPYGCAECGWSEDPFYDRSSGTSPAQEQAGKNYFVNQYGVMQKVACTDCSRYINPCKTITNCKVVVCGKCDDTIFSMVHKSLQLF